MALRVDGAVAGFTALAVLGVVCATALVAGTDEGEAVVAVSVEESADADVSGLAAAAGDAWVWAAQPAVTPARASAAPDLARTRDIRRNWHHPLLSDRPPPRLYLFKLWQLHDDSGTAQVAAVIRL